MWVLWVGVKMYEYIVQKPSKIDYELIKYILLIGTVPIALFWGVTCWGVFSNIVKINEAVFMLLLVYPVLIIGGSAFWFLKNSHFGLDREFYRSLMYLFPCVLWSIFTIGFLFLGYSWGPEMIGSMHSLRESDPKAYGYYLTAMLCGTLTVLHSLIAPIVVAADWMEKHMFYRSPERDFRIFPRIERPLRVPRAAAN